MVKRPSKSIVMSAIAGLCAGALIILGVRFVTYSPEQTHYHANFAVFINGKREQFKSPMYYEEVSGSCALGNDVKPAQRVHLHDEVNDVVHVHDHGVTWGDLFMNIDWAVGTDFIRTPDGILQPNAEQRITYLVNGHETSDISTTIIRDQDRLLVDFGDTSESTIKKEANSVARSAHHYDVSTDPAACQGNNKPTLKDRFKHLF